MGNSGSSTDLDYADTCAAKGVEARDSGNFNAAQLWFEEALRIRRAAYGEAIHACYFEPYISVLIQLGEVHHWKKRPELALSFFLSANAILDPLMDQVRTVSRSTAINQFVNLTAGLCLVYISIFKDNTYRTHPAVARLLAGLHPLDLAESQLHRAVQAVVSIEGGRSVMLITLYHTQARVFMLRLKHMEALRVMQRCLGLTLHVAQGNRVFGFLSYTRNVLDVIKVVAKKERAARAIQQWWRERQHVIFMLDEDARIARGEELKTEVTLTVLKAHPNALYEDDEEDDENLPDLQDKGIEASLANQVTDHFMDQFVEADPTTTTTSQNRNVRRGSASASPKVVKASAAPNVLSPDHLADDEDSGGFPAPQSTQNSPVRQTSSHSPQSSDRGADMASHPNAPSDDNQWWKEETIQPSNEGERHSSSTTSSPQRKTTTSAAGKQPQLRHLLANASDESPTNSEQLQSASFEHEDDSVAQIVNESTKVSEPSLPVARESELCLPADILEEIIQPTSGSSSGSNSDGAGTHPKRSSTVPPLALQGVPKYTGNTPQGSGKAQSSRQLASAARKQQEQQQYAEDLVALGSNRKNSGREVYSSVSFSSSTTAPKLWAIQGDEN